MAITIEAPKFQEGDLVEFKDFQDLKNYTGSIESIIRTTSDPSSNYTYVLSNVNFRSRNKRFPNGLINSVQVIERYIVRTLEMIDTDFLTKNGWYLSTNPNHPEHFFIKNKFPIAFWWDGTYFWVYSAQTFIKNAPFVLDPIFNEKEYDDLIIPILIEQQQAQENKS